MSKFTPWMKISTILWKAANEHLWTGQQNADGAEASCIAVKNAMGMADRSYYEFMERRQALFLRSLGCPIDSHGAFSKRMSSVNRQGARYAWLMFASMVAAEMEEAGEL